jgi:ferredoxin
VRPGGLGKLKKSIHLIGSRTCDLPASSIAPRAEILPELQNIDGVKCERCDACVGSAKTNEGSSR